MNLYCVLQGVSTNNQIMVNAHIEAVHRRDSLQIPSDAVFEADSAQYWTLPSMSSTQIFNLAISMAWTDDSHMKWDDELLPVCHRIVATLTELLNTECMRSHEQERRQVQEKLMKAQQKCRGQQRLRLSRAKQDVALAINSQAYIVN